MLGYLAFLRRHGRFLGFGALLAASSSFGQTWFVSLFGAEIRAEYGLGHAGFGAVYSAATLASGIALVWVGRLIDRVSLGRFVLLGFGVLALGCIGMRAAGGVVTLGLAVFALRIAGQGMLTHASATSMARHFSRDRGKALSVAALGFPIAESLLPGSAVAATAWLGWHGAWTACVVVLTLALAPGALWLMRAPPIPEAVDDRDAGGGARHVRRRDWTRAEVLRDRRFHLVLPALLASPFITTGVMFHQVHMAESKGWTLAWLAACYLGYAGAKVAGNLIAGPLVDRFTAVRLFPIMLPPLGLALVLLATGEHPLVALAYFALAGSATGLGGPITGAFWAERYGLAHLGSIRALAASVSVLGSALSPVVFGRLLDEGVRIETIAGVSAVCVMVAVGLVVVAMSPARAAGDAP